MRHSSSTLEALHRLCSRHRSIVEASALCGCFYCLVTFPPTEIEDWVDELNEEGATAICPHCGIDSVVPEQRDQPLSPELLTDMHAYWFERSVTIGLSPSFVQRVRLRLEPFLRQVAWYWRR